MDDNMNITDGNLFLNAIGGNTFRISQLEQYK